MTCIKIVAVRKWLGDLFIFKYGNLEVDLEASTGFYTFLPGNLKLET